MVYKDILASYFICLLSFPFLTFGLTNNCTFGGKDLSKLDSSWDVVSFDGNITFEISLCKAVVANGHSANNCHEDTSVCMHYKNGTVLSAGNFSKESKADQGNDNGELWLIMTGDHCLEEPTNNMSTLVGLRCGPTLGGPRFLEHTYCVNYFEWETSVMCKNYNESVKEVKCYLHDDDGNRYDLSPLAKKKGGYHVTAGPDTDLYINVCKDIVPDGDTADCPSGSGSCRKIKSGDKYIMQDVGELQQSLQRSTDKRLTLHYSTSADVEGCTTKPTTTINFICPERGGSQDPHVVGSFDCQYVVEWKTEYACPESSLTNNSCILTKEMADIDIDLTPLRKPPGSDDPYKVTYSDNGTTYEAFLNVCEDLNIPCPDEGHRRGIPACQLKPGNTNFGKVMGSTSKTVLRYADGELTLTYKGGQKCNHTESQRSTVINFICSNSAANNGNGQPVFSEEDDCVYIFDWETKYACPIHPVGEDCDVSYEGKHFDLSRLVKQTGDNWLALKEENDLTSYYINVCHDILPRPDTTSCEPGTAICYRSGGITHNLGKYYTAPVYDPSSMSIQLMYSHGDACGEGKHTSSVINFFCKPGHLESRPTFIRKSADGCTYEFEWHTSAACPLGDYTGQNCKVTDPTEGFSFDLTPLKKPAGQYYNVTTDPVYDFLLNICGPVTGTKCDSSDIQSAGVCQVTKDGSSSDYFVLGQSSSELHYFDGMINLTYTGGTPYHDTGSTPRKTEIAFLCDTSKGVGTPMYLSESQSKHAYLFEWYTSYACPDQSVECTATDSSTGEEYDLSGLSMPGDQGNWVVEGPGSDIKYFINVCRSLNKVPVERGCAPFAAVCRTRLEHSQESIDIPDMGRVESGPTVIREGRLELTYKSQTMCQDGSQKVPYTTHLQFVCEKSALVSAPNTPVQDGPCEYTILWNTAAACPLVKDVKTELCTVKDPNSDYIFNLQPLIKKEGAYVADAPESTFKLNICGNLTTDVCDKLASVCSIAQDGSKKILSYHAGLLEFSESGHMSLVYEGAERLANGQKVDVIINFECDRNIDLGSPEFLRKDPTAYIFTFKTPLACSPAAVDCLVQDHAGNQYDLRPLYKSTGWTAFDVTKKNSYFINVCRAINNMTIAHCSAGPIGGCQVASNGNSYSMGYIQSKPVASAGTLSLRYRNGDICHKGTPNQAHRSTRINFFCSAVNGGPVYMSETPTCEYVFTWETPAACPLQISTGANCKVMEPLFNFEFNVNSLRKQGTDYHVRNGDYDYVLNVCGPLQGSCGSSPAEVAVCQTKPQDSTFTPVSGGKANSTLTYSRGELTMTMTGGKGNCHGTYTRETLIKFTCDHSTDGKTGPIFIEEAFNCKYLFDWPTRYACPPIKVGECIVKDPAGSVYDLSSLALTNDNYEVSDTPEKKRYVINVCRSLVHKKVDHPEFIVSNQKGESISTPKDKVICKSAVCSIVDTTCPYDAAACMIDLDTRNTTARFHNIGEVNSHQVQFINGKLLLIYDHGDTCPQDSTQRLTTHIHLTCDRDATDSSPTGHFMVGDCAHHFMWSTPAACPLKGTEPVQTTNATCSVVSPHTGAILNLNQLRIINGKPWRVEDGENHLYEFNVCGAVTGSACHNASALMGICQSEKDGHRAYNGGNVLSDVYYDDGIVVLNYTGGDKCHQGQYERNTVISFVCSPSERGAPVYIDETLDCTYYIAWHTNLVCEHQVKCTVDVGSGTTLDLSPLGYMPHQLVRSSENGEVYYISVCQPLKPISGTLCPAGAAACLDTPGTASPKSLGKPKSSPTWKSDSKEVILVYPNGSKCDADPSQNYTTKIVFKCRPGPHKGTPVLVSATGCEYVFQWDTNVVCFETTPTKPTEFCGYSDPQTLAVYNFTALHATSPYEMTPTKPTEFCGYSDPQTLAVYNFTALHATSSYEMTPTKPTEFCGYSDPQTLAVYNFTALHATSPYEVPASSDRKFIMNMCGPADPTSTNACNRAMVCLNGISYGEPKDYSVTKETGELKLTYGLGGKCANGHTAQSHILFKCNRNIEIGAPKLLLEMDCYAVFKWETSKVCPPVEDKCYTVVDGHLFDLTILARDKGSWPLKDPDGNDYWINVCASVHGSPCSSDVGVCRRTKSGKVDSIGKASTADTLKSDKDGSLILEYTEGGPACTETRRRSDNPPSRTIIRFICGKTYGGPVFVNRTSTDNDCVFEFKWETKLACKVKKEEVQDIGGIVKDPRSGGSINLNPILNTSFEVHDKDTSGGETVYRFQLNGESRYCEDGAVCQQINNKNYRILGLHAQRKLYMDGDILEVEYNSTEFCSGSQERRPVSSVIQFHCNTNVPDSTGPELLYSSKDCMYVFSWETKVACLNATVIIPKVTTTSGSVNANGASRNHSMQPETIGAIVGIFLAIIVICILLVVFHNADRRAAFIRRLRKITHHRSADYTQLPSDSAHLLDEEEEVLTFNDPAEPETNNLREDTPIVTVETHNYHDDSDEDLLA